MLVIKADTEIAKAINRSKLVRQQKQVIRNGTIIPLSQRFNKESDDIRKSFF